MMAGSEEPPGPDDRLPAALPRPDETEKHLNNGDTGKATGSDASKEKELQNGKDEFGLPVKPKNRRSNGPIGKETSSKTQDNAAPQLSDSGATDEASTSQRHEDPEDQDVFEDADDGLKLKTERTVHDKPDEATPSKPNERLADEEIKAVAPAVVDSIFHGQAGAVSEWSHQALAPQKVETEFETKEEDWKSMPAYARYDLYDDDGKLIAREEQDSDDEANAYSGLGGAGKGYTRVQVDEDAKSATSMDENTDYLFKPKGTDVIDEDEDQRDPLAQLEATKDLLTEGQRIAYVGVTRLAMAEMVKGLEAMEGTKGTKKGLAIAMEAMKMWSQKMMVRLYMHMEINSSEQVMIEQLAEHGVEPGDLTPALMQNARVKNPMAEESPIDGEVLKSPKLNDEKGLSSPTKTDKEELPESPKLQDEKWMSFPPKSNDGEPLKSAIYGDDKEISSPTKSNESDETDPLPAYMEHEEGPKPEVRSPSQLGKGKKFDIDIRWTVLCDLFLVLLSDSVYDSRSRVLLERVAAALDVSWIEICRFEKRVTDSLEMQEAASKETWDEADHMENRRKLALKKRYMMMGLATVGGSLVIGLSAGLLAPVIGAGLAAGFTTIGVAGTSGFLAGAGGTALITSGAVVTGGTIAVRASNRRMGAVRTFEYRPLHNNKRVNLIVTISGWMSSKVDDVRLPYSTIDPVMGDIYSVLWEPEMLTSMGDTINILATEALTQGLQQVLGSTILVALMASLQLPIVLTKLSYLIDNPWTVSMGRANAAGLILADSLIDRNLGARPITLVGFSLGARVIFACLRELARKGAYGTIQNVYLFGSPVVNSKDEYFRARSVVSGRFVNGYASNDWILGYLFRATSGGVMRVAGLAPVEGIAGLENIDVTKLVPGHMAYRAKMPRLLREVGWEVESDEFTEIEDPDPENHDKRQRELIKELDDARKETEKKPEKRYFGLFKKGKLAEKKGWETYDEKNAKEQDDFSTSAADTQGNVLFDIEAIKAELASEQIEVKEIKSTMPPMKLNLNGSGNSVDSQKSPYSNLWETKSHDGTRGMKSEAESSQASLPNGNRENPFNQGYDEYNLSDEAVNGKLSAELSFEAPVQSPPPQHSPHSSLSTKSPRLPSPLQQGYNNSPAPQRPPSRSSMTMPSSSSPIGPEHNAWADPDDEDFGKEKEVELSFA